MAHISIGDVQAWLETTKLTISVLDANLEAQLSAQILGQLQETYPDHIDQWVDETTTPTVVRQVIAMNYAGWTYDRAFSEVETNEATTSYGATLRGWAAQLLANIVSGLIDIIEIEPETVMQAPVFYPTDVSSTWEAWATNCDPDDKSLGPNKFGMGMIF